MPRFRALALLRRLLSARVAGGAWAGVRETSTQAEMVALRQPINRSHHVGRDGGGLRYLTGMTIGWPFSGNQEIDGPRLERFRLTSEARPSRKGHSSDFG
jgi:hypothetical protein